MNRRVLIRTIVALGFIALAGLFAAPISPLSWHSPAAVEANDPPAFDSASITRTVDENTPPFQNIGDPVTATDPNNDRLTYSLENASKSPFTIVRATGQLQVGAPLDYEVEATYTVKVVVTDPDGATDTITVTINVNNVDEDGRVSLTWTKPQVNAPITASLTDPDGGISGETWQWASSRSQNGPYTNLSGNGAGSDTYTPQSDDVGNYLRVTASYTDALGPTKKANSAAGYVKPVPNPNQVPDFQVNTSGGYSCPEDETAKVCVYVRRSAPAGSDIYYPGYVHITDHDEVRYSLTGPDAPLFRIDPVRGTLFTTEAHAYDAAPARPDDPGTDGKFVITITATDPSGGSGSIEVVLTPSGSTGAPVVKGPERIQYSENGTWPLATYSATTTTGPDKSDGTRDIHGWIISVQPGGGDGDFFDIDDDGVLTFTQPPDYEDPADENGDRVYNFSLHVYDTNPPNRGRPAQTFFPVRVTVVDVEVEALEILGPSAVEYPENGTDPVATYGLEGGSGSVAWFLSGADAGAFSLSQGGELTFIQPPDYETPTDVAEENAYLVTITADRGGASKTEFVRVKVTNVNEPPEFDEGETATRSVERDAEVNHLIGEPVAATDPDEDSYLTYTLPDAQTLPFSISGYTGQLSLSGTLPQDRSSYTVVVLVTDGEDDAGNPDTSEDDRITVTINVDGDGNSAPEFPSTENGARSFPENSGAGENVGDPVAATDEDDDNLTYTLGGTDTASFQILGAGQIQTKSGQTYDHEIKSRYSVTVTANDGNGGTNTIDVTITVDNVEEPGTVTLSTNQPSARTAITASLTDLDGGVTGTTWQWQKSSTVQGAYSNIDGVTSDTYTPADEDVGDYLRATASYTDGHDSGKSAQATTTQAVRAGENRPPEFSAASDTRSFAENTAAGENIGPPVTATDGDNDRLIYTLGGTDAADFQILGTTGQIQTKAGETYDHETTPSYSVTVKADDSNGGTDTIDVTITVDDVDEPPVFTNGPTAVEFAENGEGGVASYSADDPEDGRVDLTLAGNDEALFSIENDSLVFRQSPDFEAKGSDDGDNDYQVTVQAISGTDTVTLNVTVTVTDVNEAPAFPGSETGARSVVENTPANQNIGTPVSADDPDVDADLTYSFGGGTDDSSFDLDTSTGQLKTRDALDKETKDTYYVIISVTDGLDDSGNADTAEDAYISVTITVTGENDAPEITSGPTAVTDYAENDTSGVGTYTATDQENVTINWSLDGDDDGDFDISSGGVLTFKSAPNFESPVDADTNNVYLVTVVASDGGKTDTRPVTVTVINVNEPPAFPSSETRARSVVENTPANQNIGDPVAASDPDAGASLTYSLAGTDASAFNFDTATGQIKTNLPLDKETKDSYSVEVSVRDSLDDSGNADTTTDNTITVTITVTGENDAPTITSGPATLDHEENDSGDVATYTASDPEGTTIIWSLAGDDASFFGISGGTLAFDDVPNFEVEADTDGDNDYQVTVVASDGGKSDTQAVTVTVTDVNEPPAFTAETDTREVAENTAAGQPIGSPVSATDPDAGAALIYSLDVTGAASFDIVESTGQLQTKAALDKETEDTYTVIVSVTDGIPDTAEDDSITVTITVTDEDDAPAITSGRTAIDYAENGTGDVETYTATDTDTDSASLTWIPSGDDAALFDITDGVLTFKAPPNFEAPRDKDRQNDYQVTVQVSDGPNTVTQAVTVTVTNVNELPAFAAETATREVAENTLAGQSIGAAVSATDPDAGATLIYSLDVTGAASFDIVESTGQLQTKAALDKETEDTYTVIISVTDGIPDTAEDDSITVTITVTDEDDAPAITSDRTAIDYAENGTGDVETYTATDTDTDSASLTWTLGGDDAALFDITDGVLTFKSPPNFEVKKDANTDNAYEVTVRVSDGPNSDTLDVTVTVTDINEPPWFPNTENGRRSVAENTASGVDIGSPVAATDQEGDDLFYSLTGVDAAAFAIVATTGQLQTKDTLDSDTKGLYSFTIEVRDSKGAGGTADTVTDATIPVQITVTGVNEPPVISGDATPEHPENDAGVIATYAHNDPEGGITWTPSGDDWEKFLISATGDLTFKTAPDYETPADDGRNNVYVVTLTASDGTHTDRFNVTVTVTNVNEAPTFPGPTETRTIPENTVAAQNIGLPVMANDLDAGATLTYTLGGTDAASFAIVTSSGQLQTKDDLDYETKASYSVTVSVTDGEDAGGNSNTAADASVTVTITVTDMNDAPVITGPISPTYDENATSEVATYAATDQDIGNIATWRLSGTDAASLSLSDSGVLTFNSPPDFEDPTDVGKDGAYLVVIEAFDGTVITTRPVTITITNVDENGTVTLNSVQPQVDTELTAEIVDPDGDPFGATWKWEVFTGGTNLWTTIADETSESYTPKAADLGKYLQASATYTDGQGSGKSAYGVSDNAVQAAPVANAAPTFTGETITRTVPENSPVGTNVGAPVTATDSNSDTLSYSLGDSTDAESFSINQSSGQLQTKAVLDRETKDSYTVTVKATDPSDESDTIAVTIAVTDQNEGPSLARTDQLSYPENGTADIVEYTASDPEGGTVTWSLSGTDSARFSVAASVAGSNSVAVLTFRSPPDFEAPEDIDENNAYLVTVIASDGTNSNHTDVIVTVTNVNERPEFLSTETGARSVAENTVARQPIGVPVTATDPDNGDTLTYTLGGTDAASFDIVASSGQLKTKDDLDLESKASYSVTVSVRDSKDDSGNADTATDNTIAVTITVTNLDDPPEITGGPTSVPYAENGTGDVATYTATDPENESITWSLAGSDDSFFSITDGVLKFLNPPNFEAAADADGDNEYQVTVQASDGGKTDTRAVTVTVTDVNEPPAFTAETDTRKVAENTAAAEGIGLPVSATDPDAGAALTYTLGGTDAASFSIVATSGQLQTKGALDADTKDTYTVTVSVSDGLDENDNVDTSADDTITVTITVTDQNEPPEITGGLLSVDYAENGNGPAQTYVATDPDSSSLTWTLSGDDAGQFDISGGVLTFKSPPNFEVKKDANTDNDYEVTVRVSDGPNTVTQAVTVTVADINEPPRFPNTEDGRRSVAENTASGVDIGSPVAATDQDGDDLFYSLTGVDAAAFSFDTSTGQLQTKDALNADTKDTYSFDIEVRDSKDAGGTADTVTDATISVVITVTGVNEPPVISGDPSPNHPENDAGVIATYAHNDPEGGIDWTLSGDDADDFSINSDGELKFGTAPDYETPADDDRNNVYVVTLTAYDGTHTDRFNVTVTVTNVNEAPTFPGPADTRTIPENTVAAQNIGIPVMARDPDTDVAFATLAYTLGGADAASFDIVGSSGQLQAKDDLDYESKASYSVTVSVTDGKDADGNVNPAVDASVTVTINVTDVNDAPVITGPISPTYDENATSEVATYAATDQDIGNIATWRLSGTDDASLSLSASGVLTFNSPPDFEDPTDVDEDGGYLVVIEVFDGIVTTTRHVTITIANVDEPGKVDPGAVQPQVGTELTAKIVDPDKDVSAATWKWERGSDIVTGWTIIQNETSANYTPVAADINNYLRAMATYTDGEGSGKSAQGVTFNKVRAAPVQNAAPEFSDEPATRTVPENSPVGTNVGAPVTATDSNNDTLTYSLEDSTDAESFSISQLSGQLQTKAVLDRETKDSYTVTVKATDPSDESDTIAVTIAVTDQDEGPSVARTDQLSYPENGTTDLAEYTASDPEGGTVTWSLSGTDSGRFSVAGSNGVAVLTFKTAPDFEAPGDSDGNNVYLVTVVASDGTNSNSTEVIVTVTNVNEAPEFPASESGQRTVAENTVARQPIGVPVEATDPDAGAALTYTLGGTDAASFSIVATSGQLQTKGALDADTKDTYTVTVSVSDGLDENDNVDTSADDTITVTITVTDQNEPPRFPNTEDGRRSVAENTASGVDIGSPVAATDQDGDDLIYSVTGADSAAFSFDTSTGQLQTKDALNADTKDTYSFDIEVRDSKDAGGTADTATDATIAVEITVTGVNEAPVISGDATPEHPENDAGVVATYAHNDPEGGITWTPSGDDWGKFLISATGDLTFKTAPDYETPADDDRNNVYVVTLTAYDGTHTDRFNVTVTVTNVNEAPTFPGPADTRTIPENTVAAQNIGIPVMARDPDTDVAFATLAYTLGGADAASFDIVGSSGQLQAKDDLDYESKASYSVTVSVTDGKDADGNVNPAVDASVTVTINVTDVNDAPVITGPISPTYDENATSEVATYAATDQDIGNIATWRLSGTDDASLSLSASGVLTFNSPPDFEDPTDVDEDGGYLVVIEVFDGIVTTTRHVTITIANVDEPGKVDPGAVQPQVGTELTAKIVDPDKDVSAATWKWERGSDIVTGWTIIQNETSANYTPVAADINNYLRAMATYTDGEGSGKSAQGVTFNKVRAAPVQNAAPEFSDEPATRTVPENSPVGTNVGAPVTATDSNNDTLTYSLEDSTDAESFSISQLSGQLQTKAVLDRETKDSYTVTVKATDPSDESDTIAVTIAVTDQDEGPSVARTDQLSYPENGTTDLAEYTASDPEGGTVTWSLSGTDSGRFSVAGSNGVAVLTFKTAPDFEAPGDSDGNNVYLVTVVASDGTNSNSTEVIVTVTNVNEAPEFPASESGQRTVAENTGTGQDIGDPVSANDPDAGDTLAYTLGGADAASFAIIAATGQLRTKTPLEYDNQSRYTVSVNATDTSGEGDTIAVAIIVTEVADAPAPPPPPPPPPPPQRPVPPPPVQQAPTTVPTIDSVTPGNRSLTVAWSAPGDTGGSVLTSYDLRHIESSTTNRQDSDWIVSEDAWTTSGPLVHALVGLKNDVQFDVQVRAGYVIGSGPWSDTESGTPTAGTDATDDGCIVTLGSPTATVTHAGTWTSDCESTNRTGSYALFYTFTLKEETEVQIDLTSSQDTYLFLLNGAGKSGTVEDSNDDVVVNEDTNSRVSGTLATGAYTIEATTFTHRITGDFTLTLTVPGGSSSGQPPGGTQQPPPPPAQPPTGPQTPTPPAQVGPVDAPTITTVTPGAQTLTVAWTAPTDTGGTEVTAYDMRHVRSSVTDRVDSDWIVLEDVWTGSGALEHQLTGLEDNVQYDLQVRASYAVGSGSWSLTATGTPGTSSSQTPTTESCLTSLKALTGRVERTGTWDSSCESANREGRYARFYSFTLGQSTEVQIDLTSTEDPYLFLLEGAGTGGKVLSENDDVVVNENTDSRILTTLAAGAYTIEATTYHVGQTGDFTLTISLPGGSGGSGGSQPSPPGSSGPGVPSEDGCLVDLLVLTSRMSRTGNWAWDCDSTNREGSYARFYTFTLSQEAALQIDLVSTEDPYVFLLEGVGSDGTVMAKNDDVVAGTDLNSQISATLAAGRYTIEATTYSEEVAGEFTVTIALTETVEVAPDPCVTPLATSAGVTTQTGTWADDCQATNRIGTYARYYTFTLEQDTEVRIDLTSIHDPYLFLLRGAGRNGTLAAQNDDITPAVDLNSRISITLEAGAYTVEATTYNTWDTGDFTLTIVGPEGASTLPTDNCVEDIGTPRSAVTKTGTWTDQCDSTNREGRFARFYTFTLEQEAEVQIDLVSTQDPYLFLLEGTGSDGDEVASNDDIVSNVDLDSRITVTLEAGSYTIEATTYDVGETGQFTLTLTP